MIVVNDTVRIITENGVEKDFEVVAFFTLKNNRKEYLIYTEKTTDENGNIEVYTSEVVERENGNIELIGVEDEDVWNEIKKVMVTLAKNGD